MGFDDDLHDTQFEAKLKELLKPHIDKYVDDNIKVIQDEKGIKWTHIDMDKLKKWESEICYNGYSLAYHTLLPVITMYVMGSCPFELTDEHRAFIKTRTREEALKLMNPELPSILITPIVL
jgi:hypothetical protein